MKTSYTEELKITRNNILGFPVIESENLYFKYVTKKKTKKRDRSTEKLGTNVECVLGK